MKAILILPNYQQTDQIDVMFYNGDSWRKASYRDEVVALSLPKGSARGIPKSVLENNKNQDFVLQQIIRRTNNWTFIMSTRAGTDRTGRVAFLTIIFPEIKSIKDVPTLQKDEVPNLLSFYEKNFDIDGKYSSSMREAMKVVLDPPKVDRDRTKLMIEDANNYSQLNHFTTVPFGNVVYPPDSEHLHSTTRVRSSLGRYPTSQTSLVQSKSRLATIGVTTVMIFLVLVAIKIARHDETQQFSGKEYTQRR